MSRHAVNGGVNGLEALSGMLKTLRREQGISQLDLSLRIGISQRHLSFVEIAKARPSRSLLLTWLDALKAPGSIRNAALFHAGFRPIELKDSGARCEDSLHNALTELAAAHEPHPAVIFDSDWYAVTMSEGARRLCGVLMPNLPADIRCDSRGLDMIESVAHPDGLLRYAESPALAAGALLRQFETEVWVRPSLRSRVEACAARLRASYGPLVSEARDPATPHLRLSFLVDEGRLSFFTIQTVAGLPQNVTAESLRAELWFPEDEHTGAVLKGYADRSGWLRRPAALAGAPEPDGPAA